MRSTTMSGPAMARSAPLSSRVTQGTMSAVVEAEHQLVAHRDTSPRTPTTRRTMSDLARAEA